MPEPTEGPWSAPPSGAYGQWPVLGPNCEAIAFATAQPGDRWKAAANARLMAAAPDLVLVVDKLLSFALGLGYSAVDEFQVMTEEARSAIAKAKGEGS